MVEVQPSLSFATWAQMPVTVIGFVVLGLTILVVLTLTLLSKRDKSDNQDRVVPVLLTGSIMAALLMSSSGMYKSTSISNSNFAKIEESYGLIFSRNHVNRDIFPPGDFNRVVEDVTVIRDEKSVLLDRVMLRVQDGFATISVPVEGKDNEFVQLDLVNS